METESQTKLIYQHLKRGSTITPLEALDKYGCFRLGARIYDLKRQGVRITSTMIEKDGKRFAQYRLEA